MFPELSAHLGPIYFSLFALVAVACGVNLLLSRHPLIGAISLIGVMLSLSGLYALLQSPFVAVLQVLVYAGAIMMLVIFVIMVLNQARDHQVPGFDRAAILGIAVPAALGALVCRELCRAGLQHGENALAQRGGIDEIAARLFATGGVGEFAPAAIGQGWWLLVEIGGLVLLTAVVGAVLLAKRRLDPPAEAPARLDAHEIEVHG